MDDPTFNGRHYRRENYAPYDLRGGAPFSTAGIAAGNHNIVTITYFKDKIIKIGTPSNFEMICQISANEAAISYIEDKQGKRNLREEVEEFLLNAALVSVVAQRLARRLCPHCAAPDDNQTELY